MDISLRRLLSSVAIVVALAWLSWSLIAETAAINLAHSVPDKALQFNAREPAALDQLARNELVDPDGDLDAAKSWAQQALRARPMDDEAIFLLGLIAQRQHDTKGAATLMRIAGARTWRNTGTQAWLYADAFRHGDFAEALAHGDAILRVAPNFEKQLYASFALFTRTPQSMEALVSFLATDPPWRSTFLRWISDRLVAEADLDHIYAGLRNSAKPPTTKELEPYVGRLVKSDRFVDAYRIWRDTLPPDVQPSARYPYNRDFAQAVGGLPFNWQIKSVPGADIQIVAPDNGKKLALRIQFSGARVSFANVRQLMMLPAGRYSLRGRVMAEDLHTPRGLQWHVFCASDAGSSLVRTPLVSGSIPWSNFAEDFEVPTEGCQAQWLQLELPARIASESQIAGQVWYQFLRIIPLGSGGAAGG